MRRCLSEDKVPISDAIFEEIIRNFDYYENIYDDEIIGNIICVFKHKMAPLGITLEKSMDLAREFYTYIHSKLYDENNSQNPIKNEEFKRLLNKSIHQIINLVEKNSKLCSKENYLQCNTPECANTSNAFCVLIKNSRRTQDDRAIIIKNLLWYAPDDINSEKCKELSEKLDLNKIQIYAVMDGHRGSEVSNYCQLHLGSVLIDTILNHFDPKNPQHFNIEEILRLTIDKLNQNLLTRHSNIKSGSTIVINLVYNETIYTSWRGDSLAGIIDSTPTFIPLNQSLHLVSDPNEQKILIQQNKSNIPIIQNVGGVERLYGALLVSRSLGDSDYQTIQLTDISTYCMKGNEKILLLGSDGFWDIVIMEEFIELLEINKSNNKTTNSRISIVSNVSNYIQKKRGKDNASLIIVFLTK